MFASSFLILAPVILACYNLIIIPQKRMGKHLNFINQQLVPGDKILLVGGDIGTVLYIFKSTVIIELENGCKTEILKQTIKFIHEKK